MAHGSGDLDIQLVINVSEPTRRSISFAVEIIYKSACLIPLSIPTYSDQEYLVGSAQGSYDAPAIQYDPLCTGNVVTYTNSISPPASFIESNSGQGKLITYETSDSLDVDLYTISITASLTNVCLSSIESLTYTLNVKEGCLTTTNFQPSVMVMQEYTITTAPTFYTFDMFTVEPVTCE